MAPKYLSEMIHPVTNCDSRYHLRFSDNTSFSPTTRRYALAERSFTAAEATA